MKLISNFGLAIVFAFALASCNTKDKQKGAVAGVDNATDSQVYPVEVQHIQEETIPRTIDYTANLIAWKEVHYAPSSPGRIKKIIVEVGSRVSKGEVLVEMDRTQLQQAITQLDNARANYQRVDTLHQLNSISEQQYDQAKTQYELAKSSYKFQKENTTLLSPINGIVTGKYFENGELYSAAPNTSAGKAAIVSLMTINPLKAIVNVSQSYYPYLKKGMKADITIDILPGKVFEGSVYKIHPTINPATRTFQTEMLIENNDEVLRPGMFATIEIKMEEEKALVVPAIAILKQEGTNNRHIFVNNNGTARQVEVKTGERYDDKVEVISNEINVGDELIVEGQANLLNGSRINITNK